ncbi:MAG TPA: hypothetical protein EYP35_07495 [Desulfobacterales bacterium]|nr:hypothetical protein [Desulfobacterales bacterium]HIP39941.1 hypothetical protein [Desulfocapsa sulfexigens]
MNPSILLSLALGSGWLLSPESLVIAGNSAGQLGFLILPLLAAVALLFTGCGKLLNNQSLPATDSKEFQIIQNLTGTIPAAGITIAACVPLTVLAATALLVTAGYTFNEVFLYWFPNFGFSFLLLALLTILQLFPEKIIFRAQICFTALAAGGLIILALSGMTGGERPATEIAQQPFSFASASPAVLLFIFAGSTFSGKKQTPSFLVPLAGFVIFFLWTFASLNYVNPERLASSTIPYMTAARKILGDPGRQIMGIVIISGTSAAVTGLMLLSRHMLANIFVKKETDKKLLGTKVLRWFFPPLIAIITAVLLATGLAGDELLEVLLRSALILWLLYYSFLCLSALVWINKSEHPIPLQALLSTLFLLISLCTLMISNPHKTSIYIFIFSALGISSIIAAGWFSIHKKTNKQMEVTA